MSKITLENGEYKPIKGFEDHPVICVSWIGAMAFSLWVGGRLPTETEWERACRGNVSGELYPWGNEEANPHMANYEENIGYTTPVGTYPPNSVGLFDMAGNTWEWLVLPKVVKS